MDDAALLHAVTEELDWAPHVDASHITVAVRDGIVCLGGVVGSLAEKHAAERTVWHLRGATGLVQEIAVRTAPARRHSDAELAERVRSVLLWDAQIPDARLRIKVADGWVTLIGTLAWQYQKEAAEASVRRLEGVLGVANEIVVRPGIGPGDIAAQVRRALARHTELDAGRITVAAADGTVQLTGSVRSLRARRTAETAAWSARGVQAVENRLEVVA
jgi:osmotically-inducible protein OsmY